MLTNVIVWGDSAPEGPEIYNDGSSLSISYSDIQGCGGSGSGWNLDYGTDGGGNIDADPRFVDAANGNLRLKLTSPAIDAGNNAAVPSGVTTDLTATPASWTSPPSPTPATARRPSWIWAPMRPRA